MFFFISPVWNLMPIFTKYGWLKDGKNISLHFLTLTENRDICSFVARHFVTHAILSLVIKLSCFWGGDRCRPPHPVLYIIFLFFSISKLFFRVKLQISDNLFGVESNEDGNQYFSGNKLKCLDAVKTWNQPCLDTKNSGSCWWEKKIRF